MPGPVRRFVFTPEIAPDLRANGRGWMLRGRFSITVLFEPAADVGRYEYRQYICGTAWTQTGYFPDLDSASMRTWRPLGNRVDAAQLFDNPGGLPRAWAEDAQGSERFGHRDAVGVSRAGLVDRYLPDQANGDRYELVDTYGIEGANRVHGTKVFFSLRYRFVIVDSHGGRLREVRSRIWNTRAERILPGPSES